MRRADRKGRGFAGAALASLLILLGACGSKDSTGQRSTRPGAEAAEEGVAESGNAAPPRVEEAAEVPVFNSRVALPVVIPMATLEKLVNEQVPQRLVTIDRDYDVCIEPRRVRVGSRRIAVTPTIRCRIVGQVDREPIRLSANGRDPNSIRLTFPVSATVSAKDIGRIIRQETGTAEAEVRAILNLRLNDRFEPVARISIDYDWTKRPGIEILGRRFTFAGRADPQLARIIADLERTLPGKLRTLGLERQAADAWARGFTSVSVNRENPEVWIRLTPRRLSSGGFRIEGDKLVARLALEAGTETFLGPRPPDPKPVPLPRLARLRPGDYGVRFAAPVIADYSELEPVLHKELAKLSERPLELPVAGRVDVRFERPTIYATTGERLAIGIPMQVGLERGEVSTRGTIWLTGLPINQPDSRKVRVTDLAIAGESDSTSVNLLLAAAQSPRVLGAIETALAHDFEGDFQKLMTKINTVLAGLPIGDFVASATVQGVGNGKVQAIGQGLFMPVEAYGEATLAHDPAGVRRILAQRQKDREARAARRAAQQAADQKAAASGSGGQPGPALL